MIGGERMVDRSDAKQVDRLVLVLGGVTKVFIAELTERGEAEDPSTGTNYFFCLCTCARCPRQHRLSYANIIYNFMFIGQKKNQKKLGSAAGCGPLRSDGRAASAALSGGVR